jgi:hypothetical protein
MYLFTQGQSAAMVGEAIANFEPYVWVAVGLFVVGLFGVMVYEKSSSRSKQQQPAAADDKRS